MISANWKQLSYEDKLPYQEAAHPKDEQLPDIVDEGQLLDGAFDFSDAAWEELEKLTPHDQPVEYVHSDSDNGSDGIGTDSDNSDSEDEV